MAEERTHTDSGTGTPIAENEQVKALLALLKENDSPAYVDFAKLIESVTGMENRLSIAVGELEAMREDLQKMQDRSLKASLQKTCKTLEGNIASMQQKLSELKGKIVEGCRHILEDFKERGTIALNGLANFLHLKPVLEAVRQGAENHRQTSNRAMERIDAFVSEYHEAGKHLKNMCLALMGKEPVQQAKAGGEIARYVRAPYRASRACIFGHAEAWCKEDGKPLEFDSRKAAEAYAGEMNSRTNANVHYYAQEKEPEPGAVRKTSAQAQPDLDARAHEEVTPRNDAAEKQNEIPGRQVMPETDPLVEIRSAVHSNYAGMVAMLGADNRVYLGREERCHCQDMQASYYDNQDGSLCFVCDQPDMYYFLYGEGWAHTQAEMLERGLTLRQYE